MADEFDYSDGGDWFSTDPVVLEPVTADPNDTTAPPAEPPAAGGDFNFFDSSGNLIPDTTANAPDEPGFWDSLFSGLGSVAKAVGAGLSVGAGGGSSGGSSGGTNSSSKQTTTKVTTSTNVTHLALAAGLGALIYHVTRRK